MIIETDVLVIGAGGAGTRAAIEAAITGPHCQITILSQGPIGKTGLTPMANGGMHWVCHPEDSPQSHLADVVRIGSFLNDQNLVEKLAQDAPKRAEELIAWGAKPILDGDKILVTNPKSSGASFPRGHLVPGVTYIKALRKELQRHKNVTVLEDYLATKLLIKEGKAIGAIALNIRTGEIQLFNAKSTILATGGLGEIFSVTTNAPFGLHGHASGLGYSLAYHAGAELIDMEMVQFTGHQLYPPWLLGNPQLLSTMCGGKYLNGEGQEFMEMPQPRDMIQRLADKEIREGRGTERGGVTIDLSVSHLSSQEIEKQLNISLGGDVAKNRWKLIKEMSENNPDPKNWKVEFTPGGAHFCMGGVRINENAETTIEGLFAAGEVSGGVHGANRMAGNALSEIVVFGAISGKSAAEYALVHSLVEPYPNCIEQEEQKNRQLFRNNGKSAHVIQNKLRQILTKHLGVARNQSDMEQALIEIEDIRANDLPDIRAPKVKTYNLGLVEAIETPCMLDVVEMVTKSALYRTESRGAHFREDFPEVKSEWLKHTCVLKKDNEMTISKRPIVVTQIKLEE